MFSIRGLRGNPPTPSSRRRPGRSTSFSKECVAVELDVEADNPNHGTQWLLVVVGPGLRRDDGLGEAADCLRRFESHNGMKQ